MGAAGVAGAVGGDQRQVLKEQAPQPPVSKHTDL